MLQYPNIHPDSYLGHFEIPLVMLEEQIWKSKLPILQFTNSKQYSGVFGLYGLEGQTEGIIQILNAS